MSQGSENDSWVRAALEGSGLAAWVWDVASDRVKLSESWMEMLGEPRREITVHRRELAALVHPDDLARVLSVLDAVTRGRTSAYDVEHRVRTVGGGYRWIQSRGKVTERDAAGRPLRLTGTNADITARQRAEEMLAARELQLRLVTDSVPAMIVELDANDRIRYCNSRYAEHSGKSAETLIGQTLAEAVDQAAYERFAEHRSRIRSGQPVTYERVMVRPDRPEAQLRVQVVPRIGYGRDYAGCFLMIEDVTERKRLEKMKETFISTVSHELRTPLDSIRASLDQIAASAPSAGASQQIDAARASCGRLMRLVNDILDYQRLRAGQPLPGQSTLLDLAGQVREATAANESLAREAGVALRVTAPVPILVSAHADRVAQLVTNLVANALKHSSSGDTVEIAVERRERCARVSVRDRGPGVPADFQPQLFQQFSQAQAADGKKRGGTGLGLAISKAIAEQMNGKIGFEPADGPGAVFWFELPLP
ncbi:MAG: ATP-binding protein [Pseudomonadota bacterium]